MHGRLISTPYYGGKNRPEVQDAILAALEPLDGYMEPFGGSASILLNRAPVRSEVLNDIDGNITNFFRTLRDRSDDLIRALTLTPFARAERDACLAALERPEDLDELERARTWYAGVALGSRCALSSGFASLLAKTDYPPAAAFAARVTNTLPAVADRLRRVGIECTDGVKLLAKIADRPDWTAYCDPPYPLAARAAGAVYAHDDDERLHERLLDIAANARCQIVISTYDTPLYRRRLAHWHRQIVSIDKPSSLASGDSSEVLYVNRPPCQPGLPGTKP